jgi:hypothetical protein
MNRPKYGIFAIAMTALLLLPGGELVAQIYKSVDKDGNVIYSDQPPSPDAQPVELPGLSVVDAVQSPAIVPGAGTAGEGAEKPLSLQDLRRMYRDFAIISPAHEEWIQGTGNSVTISWGMREAPQPGMMVIPIIDGNELPPASGSSITLEEVVRGEHVVSARLVDAQRRTVANASPVTFFMRQFSTNFRRNPATPAPSGG